jgi:hypothetical protein
MLLAVLDLWYETYGTYGTLWDLWDLGDRIPVMEWTQDSQIGTGGCHSDVSGEYQPRSQSGGPKDHA